MLDRRSHQSPMRDQGRRGTCVSFAATAAHEMLRADGIDLSEEFLHWAAKQRDALPGREGTTLGAAAAALAELGQPPEDSWPYDDGRDQRAPTYQPPDEARAVALTRRLLGGGRIDPSARAVRKGLDEGLAVQLGVRLHATWYFPSSDGSIGMPISGLPVNGGHAVLVVGYIDGKGEGGGRFTVRNSWGADWADEGYGYLPYDYVDDYAIESWGFDVNGGQAGGTML